MREQAEAAGRSLGVAVAFVEVRRTADLDPVFASMSEARIGALVVSPTPMLFEARSEIVAQAAKSGLPTIYPWREAVDAGGLASYATNFPEMYRCAASYVDKILKGARPAELPIEQPTQLEFVINLAPRARASACRSLIHCSSAPTRSCAERMLHHMTPNAPA